MKDTQGMRSEGIEYAYKRGDMMISPPTLLDIASKSDTTVQVRESE